MNSAKFEEISLLVRSAEVSLFIGSGFSLKAGAPSASYLVNSLARLFPKGYKKGLRYLPLDDIASEYVKLCQGNREPLMEFLRKKMDFKRTDLSDHLRCLEFLTSKIYSRQTTTRFWRTVIQRQRLRLSGATRIAPFRISRLIFTRFTGTYCVKNKLL